MGHCSVHDTMMTVTMMSFINPNWQLAFIVGWTKTHFAIVYGLNKQEKTGTNDSFFSPGGYS